MSQLVLSGSLKEFFRMLVGEVVKRQRVSIEEVTEFYVVNLLSDYAKAEKLFTQEVDGKRETEPLAVLYHRALQQEREEKIRTLRQLGDVSLYTAGFFNSSLKDSVVGADYYVQMGRNAYSAVADLAGTSAFAGVYQELCLKFSSLVEVLEEISARGLAATGPQGQLKVFETWSRTGNNRLEQVLIDSGMLPAKKLLAN
ncbi:MAG: hypothetical protein Q8L48_14400 [Archangium sp.]|jgi:hypothetical protein|nr:hypothetical protein [Archangium sp.]